MQHLHAAHRPADHGKQAGNAEVVHQQGLRPHHVADRHQRKIETIGPARIRVGRCRPAGTKAAANHVGADHEEPAGVDRTAGPDQHLPPARFAGDRVVARDMLVAGQGMADEHRIRAFGIEDTIGLVSDLPALQRDAAIHGQGSLRPEQCHMAFRRLVGLAHRVRQQCAGFPVLFIHHVFCCSHVVL